VSKRASEPEKPKRLSQGQIIEWLLTKPAREHNTVSLKRNRTGDTEIEVVVRAGETGEFQSVDDAALKATQLYDSMRARYPMLTGGPKE